MLLDALPIASYRIHPFLAFPRLAWAGLLVGLLLVANQAVAQSPPSAGVVWEVPDDIEQAEADLREMHRRGVEAVRTGLIQQQRLLTLADTLGLQFFQELPLDAVPAARLADTLAYAQRLLELALARARDHPSARHFGLARRSDTSVPAACVFFEQLTERVHRLPGGLAYYLSVFIEDDRCAGVVDLVLLDALDAPDPASLPVRYQAAHGAAARVGLGSLGTWVRAGARPGLNTPHSPEVQARYLETHLRAMLVDTTTSPLQALFVYRWRDHLPGAAIDPGRPFAHGYGLYTTDGAPRPALDVVEGFFTGRRTTFAFSGGTAPPQPVPWALLMGWVVLLLIAGCYAFSSRFRLMVPRYFQAHAFYRDSVREGREVLLGVSVVLLLALALSVGVMGSVVLDVLRHTTSFRLLFGLLPGPVQRVSAALLAQPWMLVLLLSSFYALGLALWTSLLTFASRRRHPLMPGQALMLVLWARWPMLLLLLGAMVVPSLPDPLALRVVLGLAGTWGLFMLYAIARTLYDYASITYVPGYYILIIWLANPVMVLALAGLLMVLEIGALRTFIWHLATRT